MTQGACNWTWYLDVRPAGGGARGRGERAQLVRRRARHEVREGAGRRERRARGARGLGSSSRLFVYYFKHNIFLNDGKSMNVCRHLGLRRVEEQRQRRAHERAHARAARRVRELLQARDVLDTTTLRSIPTGYPDRDGCTDIFLQNKHFL